MVSSLRGGALTHVDEIKRLIERLEKCAQNGEEVRLSSRENELLRATLYGQRQTTGQSKAPAVGGLFQVAVLNDKGGIDRILGHTSDIAIARAMFGAAAKQYPDRRIRLYQSPNVIAETT